MITKLDYIIVGGGLAGLSFASILRKNKKSFMIFHDGKWNSSKVAGGFYNPVILKRFSPVWNIEEQLGFATNFFHELETELKTNFDYKIPIWRIFNSIQEQNNWFIASDKPRLEPFLNLDIIKETIEGIHSPYGFGKVNQSGRIDTSKFLSLYHEFLKDNKCIRFQTFHYEKLAFKEGKVRYDELEASKIVFAEGFGLKDNPFFRGLPLNGTKGELLTLRIPNFNLNVAIKAGVFIVPLGNDLFRVGATFNWTDKTEEPSEEGEKELLEKLTKFLKVPFEIVERHAGIRPTVKDRRPLLGRHQDFSNVYILNGLGTRGVLIGPLMAKKLYEFIEYGKDLDLEIAISRFGNEV